MTFPKKLRLQIGKNPASTALSALISGLIGFSIGLGLWYTFHPSIMESLIENDLGLQSRYDVIKWGGGASLFIVIGCYLAYHFWWRQHGKTLLSVYRSFNRYAILGMIIPYIPFMHAGKVSERHPFFTLLACFMVAVIVALVAYRAAEKVKLPNCFHSRHRWYVPILVVLFSAIYAALISHLHIIHHRNGGTHIHDFGVYANTLWQTAHGNILGCSILKSGSHLWAHFDPILIPISTLFWVTSNEEWMLVFQAVWLSLGTIPIYLIALRQIGKPWFGLFLCVIYLFHPGLHGMNMFDFHSLTLAGPIIMWVFYFMETSNLRAYWIAIFFLLATREDMAFIGMLFGLYALSSGKQRRLGLATVGISIVYFIFVKNFLMGEVRDFSSYIDEVAIGGHSMGASIILSLLSNPIFVLKNALTEPKIIYFIKLLLPLVMLPLFAGKIRILFLYGFFFVFFASKPAVYSLGFQYVTFLLPMLILAVPAAVKRVLEKGLPGFVIFNKENMLVALVCAMAASTLLLSYQYGVFWPNRTFRAGYRTVQRTPTKQEKDRYVTLKKIKTIIGPEAAVSASQRLGAHFATRKTIYRFPRKDDVRYLILWHDDLRGKHAKEHRTIHDSGKYTLLMEENGVLLYQRKRQSNQKHQFEFDDLIKSQEKRPQDGGF